MAKNPNDKYYTQESEVKKVIEIMLKHIPKESITELIEPAAGDGAFIEEIKKLGIPYKFYDLIPEHPEIEQKDFKDLMKEMEYKKGRVFVGNPPFGNASSLFKRFRNGAMEKGDWAVYIGPASHWNMKWGLKGMELVYSEHLGGVEYRGLENKKVNTCVNVYKRGGTIEDKRMEMLERDFEIRNILKYSYGKWGRNGQENCPGNNYDFYLDLYPNRSYLLNIDEEKCGSYLGIKVNNIKLLNQTEVFLKEFYQKNIKDIMKIKGEYPRIDIPFVKQKMIEHFYPTREEMLERDFEIKAFPYTHDWDFDKDLIYDFYVVAWGKNWGDIKYPPLDKGTYWGIKIFNESKRKEIEDFFKNKVKEIKEVKTNTESGISLQKTLLKQKMIEHFYPTREEMLERDFEIKSWAEDGYDFYLRGMDSNSKNIGKDIADFSYDFKVKPSIGIKVKNILFKNKTEIFLKEFKKNNLEEIKKLSPNNTWISIKWLKQKMIEEFYSDIPEYFD